MHRCGHASGLQRYRCLSCGCSFNALTGAPLARLRKRAHWLPVRLSQMKACLHGVLDPAILLVSGGAPVYRRFASETGVRHRYVNLNAGVRSLATFISRT